jgi:hypothetical protein
MAPAVIGAPIPSPAWTPIKATPAVPIVPKEVPVTRDIIRQTKNVVGRKKDGEMTCNP